MSYKEKLLKLHSVAMAKTLVLMDYEAKYITYKEECGEICDPAHYEKRMELYFKMQEALAKRDDLAKVIMANKIKIEEAYPVS